MFQQYRVRLALCLVLYFEKQNLEVILLALFKLPLNQISHCALQPHSLLLVVMVQVLQVQRWEDFSQVTD